MRNGKLGKRKYFSERVNVHIQDEEVFIFQLCPNDDSEVRWVQRIVQECMSSILELEMCNTERARLSVLVLAEVLPFINDFIIKKSHINHVIK